jgi:3-phosphoglycerate kinase
VNKLSAGKEAIAHTLAEIGKTGAITIIGGGDSVVDRVISYARNSKLQGESKSWKNY